MALADRIQKAGPKSKFEQWLDTLSPSNRDVVLDWLSDSTQSNASVARAVREDDAEDGFIGYPANSETIAAWRRAHGAR
ncbi:MAG: hypothetical protein IJO71_09325 [Microbacterium sp.]|uniref:hypothetical protein n=1 Tax=Microbacterium sp. TaxID=51671 RepID=UPI0025DB2735|nr:hypothetical protein [Microbacterium sp.]MBQ9917381.1 hypothetical protein [Microbacterium sp.]